MRESETQLHKPGVSYVDEIRGARVTLATIPTFEVLAFDECVRLLQTVAVGRLAWVRAGSPVIVPVNYAWDGEAIVIRSDPGTKLFELKRSDAAFEVDDIDAPTKSGWSILAVGTPYEVDPEHWPAHATPPDQLGLEVWAPGSKDHWIRLVPRNLSGRRLIAHRSAMSEWRPDSPVQDPYWRLAASDDYEPLGMSEDYPPREP